MHDFSVLSWLAPIFFTRTIKHTSWISLRQNFVVVKYLIFFGSSVHCKGNVATQQTYRRFYASCREGMYKAMGRFRGSVQWSVDAFHTRWFRLVPGFSGRVEILVTPWLRQIWDDRFSIDLGSRCCIWSEKQQSVTADDRDSRQKKSELIFFWLLHSCK